MRGSVRKRGTFAGPSRKNQEGVTPGKKGTILSAGPELSIRKVK